MVFRVRMLTEYLPLRHNVVAIWCSWAMTVEVLNITHGVRSLHFFCKPDFGFCPKCLLCHCEFVDGSSEHQELLMLEIILRKKSNCNTLNIFRTGYLKENEEFLTTCSKDEHGKYAQKFMVIVKKTNSFFTQKLRSMFITKTSCFHVDIVSLLRVFINSVLRGEIGSSSQA